MILNLSLMALLLMSAPQKPPAEPAPQPDPELAAEMLCVAAEGFYERDLLSEAISEVNRCISEEALSERHRACAVLNRAKYYLALGALDKAMGDRDSAIAKDPELGFMRHAAKCLNSDEEFAANLINLEGY